ncbi:MAG: MauE/DoxX family redox-associated membrane protein [Candidatus Omnitrophota bacterium]
MKSYAPWFLARLFLGLIFVYAGFTKLVNPVENFQAVLAAYRLIPYAVVPALAAVSPWIELVFGTFLILGYGTRWSALALTSCSLIFVALLGWEFAATGRFPSDCGCFGTGFFRPTVPQIFFMDLANVFIGLRLFLWKNHPLSLDRWLNPA